MGTATERGSGSKEGEWLRLLDMRKLLRCWCRFSEAMVASQDCWCQAGQLGVVKGCSVVESETSASNLLGGLEPGPLHLRAPELVSRECAPWCPMATGAGGPRPQGAWSGTHTGYVGSA